MNNLNANPTMSVQQAAAILESNGLMVYESRHGGYAITTKTNTRDGFTAHAIIEMAKSLKTKPAATTEGTREF